MTVTLEEIENYYTILLDENGKEDQLLTQRKRLTDAIYAQVDSGTAPDDDHIAEIAAALQKDIQLRDFVLGLPSEREVAAVNKYLTYFYDTVPTKFIAPIATAGAFKTMTEELHPKVKEGMGI